MFLQDLHWATGPRSSAAAQLACQAADRIEWSPTLAYSCCSELPCTGPCATPMRGVLAAGLERLPFLQTLDLSWNELGGGLPREWGAAGAFPSLQLLDLQHNALAGPIPDEWAWGGGFQRIVDFQVGLGCLARPPAWPGLNFLAFQTSLCWKINPLAATTRAWRARACPHGAQDGCPPQAAGGWPLHLLAAACAPACGCQGFGARLRQVWGC